MTAKPGQLNSSSRYWKVVVFLQHKPWGAAPFCLFFACLSNSHVCEGAALHHQLSLCNCVFYLMSLVLICCSHNSSPTLHKAAPSAGGIYFNQGLAGLIRQLLQISKSQNPQENYTYLYPLHNIQFTIKNIRWQGDNCFFLPKSRALECSGNSKKMLPFQL